MVSIKLISIVSVCIAFASLCNGSVDIKDFFPFGDSVNDTDLSTNIGNGNLDDGSSRQVSLTNKFQFFGKPYSALFVNINGGVSFNAPISTYTPTCTPLSQSMSMISPFWADVDLRIAPGKTYYRQTTDSHVLNKALDDIKTAFPHMNDVTYMKWAFVATWNKVAFFGESNHDRLNTFQMALVTDDKYSFAIFYYNNITWTTGTASQGTSQGLGGIPARAGFDNGEGKLFILPGSCNASIVNIANQKMSNGPGKFVFRVNEESIVVPGSASTLHVITAGTESIPKPTPSTKEGEEEFRKHNERTTLRATDLRSRILLICDRLITRPALENKCYREFEKLKNLIHELKLTRYIDELERIDHELQRIALAMDQIEKDISFWRLF